MNGPNPNPEPETTILHLDKLVPGAPAPSAPDESVTAFIAKAAAETVEQSARPVVVPAEAGPLPAESMLGVVSYCYTKGVYGSADIGRKLAQNSTVREATHGDIPRPEDIRRFRRLNREAIQLTVEKALRYARRKFFETLTPPNPFRADGARPASNPATASDVTIEGRREETQAFAKREAAERLDKATFIDGMSM